MVYVRATTRTEMLTALPTVMEERGPGETVGEWHVYMLVYVVCLIFYFLTLYIYTYLPH